MIVHVYNPDRILNTTNKLNSKVDNRTIENKPPPSPKLLRRTNFKGVNYRSLSPEAKVTADPCGLKRLPSSERNAMDSAAEGLPSWASRGSTPSGAQMSGCTCQCNAGGGGSELVSSSPNRQTAEDYNTSVVSNTSSHYFTPPSSFLDESGNSSSRQPDSLEYQNVKGSPTLNIRKANLDRILSPRTVRKSYANAIPAEMTREKSLSPVQAGIVQPLSTSMSNASIHSNYSDDSLMAASSSNAQRFNSPSSRWNNINLNNAVTTDCYKSLPCGHLNWITEKTSPISAHCDTPIKEKLDFSKDSLNSSAVTNNSVNSLDSSVPAAGAPEGAIVQEEEDASKLEPLAFTIEFGETKKKKETPKRFVERLASSHKRNLSLTRNEDKKGESGSDLQPATPSSTAKEKMLKSLTRVGDHALGQFNGVTEASARRSTTITPKKGGRSCSANSSVRHSSLNRNSAELNDRRKQEPTHPHQPRSPSPRRHNASAYVYNNTVNNNSRAVVDRASILPTPTRTTNGAVQRNVQSSEPTRKLVPPSPKTVKKLRRSSSVQPDLEKSSGGWTNDDDSGLDESAHRKSAHRRNEADDDDDEAGDEEGDDEEEEEEEDEEEEEFLPELATSGDDAVSETGTYTIGQDSPSLEEDQSRRDIDRVFGLLGDPASTTSGGVSSFSPASTASLTPHWIREWAAQVAQQQEKGPQAHLCGVSKPPSAPPRPPEGGLNQQSSSTSHARPRRRLPSVPSAGGSSCGARSRSSPRPSDMSDPSDSSLETESFLRDTESVVSAMQARVDGRSSTESDIETRSCSSYRQSTPQQQQQQHSMEHENSIGRKLSAQLRAKIRSLDESYPTSSGSSSSRNLRETAAVTAAAVAAAAATAAAVTATSTYTAAPSSVIHNELHFEDTKSLHSDSSSDITSGEATNPSRSRHTTHDDAKISGHAPAVRYNRALSLRRGRLGLDESLPATTNKDQRRNPNGSPSRGVSPQVTIGRKHSTASSAAPTASSQAKTANSLPSGNSSFSRSDGGRFSLRVGSKASSNTSTTPSNTSNSSAAIGRAKLSKSHSSQLQGQNQSINGSASRKSRSNSTLSPKEAEFQNWKRRKNYDPMKAAAEGKKKEAARRAATLTMSQSMISTATGPGSMISSPSSQSPSPPPRTIIRSASFTCVNNAKSHPGHGATQQAYNNGNKRRTSHHKPAPLHNSALLYSSDDENEILTSPKKTTASPKPSPLSTRKYLGLNLSTVPRSSPPSLPADISDLASITSADIDPASSPGSPRRKLYMEDGLLMRTSASNSSLRARTKLEVLDNLVISTIHGLSTKIRTNAETLLRKLRPQYTDDVERMNLIDDALHRLSDCVVESPIHSVTTGRSSSRELSGTLKVMKRVEQVFQALDQVLFEDVLDGGGEEGAILNEVFDGSTQGEDWINGYTSAEFY